MDLNTTALKIEKLRQEMYNLSSQYEYCSQLQKKSHQLDKLIFAYMKSESC